VLVAEVEWLPGLMRLTSRGEAEVGKFFGDKHLNVLHGIFIHKNVCIEGAKVLY